MAIPIENGSEDFTPPSLTNLPTPPVFRLRAGTWRDKSRYRHMIKAEGVSGHSLQDIRDEIIKAVHAGWSLEHAVEIEARLKEFWDATEYYAKENAGVENPEPFSHSFAEAADGILAQVVANWRPLSRMAADNDEHDYMIRLVAVALFVDGWTGIDVPFAREGGAASLERVNDVAEALSKIETANAKSGIEGIGAPATAFNELVLACLNRLTLDKSAEKNSSSPPPASDDPSGSQTDGQGKSPGTSKASATSPKTPAA